MTPDGKWSGGRVSGIKKEQQGKKSRYESGSEGGEKYAEKRRLVSPSTWGEGGTSRKHG